MFDSAIVKSPACWLRVTKLTLVFSTRAFGSNSESRNGSVPGKASGALIGWLQGAFAGHMGTFITMIYTLSLPPSIIH